MKIGDRYVSYSRLEPLGMLLGVSERAFAWRPLVPDDADARDKLWRLHRRNERRRNQRIEAAAASQPAAAVVTFPR